MADVVTDRLFEYPAGIASWQNDAGSTDTNEPQDGDLMTFDSTTALAGNLRRVKSEVRGLSVNSGWINYLGLTSIQVANNVVAIPSPNPPTWNSGTVLTFAGDWTSIIQPGRRVRATLTNGTQAAATIIICTLAGATTQMTVDALIFGATAADLAYVEFSALGSPSDTLVPDATGPLLNASPIFVTPVGSGLGTRFVIPPLGGGTGTDSNAWGGDLSGTYPPMAPTVFKIQGNEIQGAPINNTDTDQVFNWDGVNRLWKAARISVISGIGALSGNDQAGTLQLPNSSFPLFLKWLRLDSILFTAGQLDGVLGPFNWDVPFPGGPYFVWCFCVDPRVAVTWDGVVSAAQVSMRYRNSSMIYQTANTVPFTPSTPNDPVTFDTTGANIDGVQMQVWALAIGA